MIEGWITDPSWENSFLRYRKMAETLQANGALLWAAETFYQAGASALRTSDPSRAIECYVEAGNCAPDFSQTLVYFSLADLYVKKYANWVAGATLYQKTAKDHYYPDFHRRLAWAKAGSLFLEGGDDASFLDCQRNFLECS